MWGRRHRELYRAQGCLTLAAKQSSRHEAKSHLDKASASGSMLYNATFRSELWRGNSMPATTLSVFHAELSYGPPALAYAGLLGYATLVLQT